MKSKLPHTGTSIFSVMSGLAAEHNAINLSQGFPEFDTPNFLKNKLFEYSQQGKNQYSPYTGIAELQHQIALLIERKYQHKIDGSECVTVTSGATEALFVAIQAVVDTGDEVIVFDPAYDSYEPAIALAGGHTVHVALDTPSVEQNPAQNDAQISYSINWQAVKNAISDKTRAIIINTPHNPSATMLSESDFAQLKELVLANNLWLISDEVYEHINFDQQLHLSVLRDKALFERAFVISSFGKTFHCTGWKVGYCTAPPALSAEFRKIHQYVTFSTFTPAQLAIADMLREHPEHIDELAAFYQQKRDLLISAIKPSRFKVLPSAGTYFLLLDYSDISSLNDVEFCEYLVKEVGVAAIPLSVFYQTPPQSKIIRLCFAKHDNTLQEAAKLLCKL